MGAIIIHADGGGEGVVFQMSLQVDKLQYIICRWSGRDGQKVSKFCIRKI